MVELLHGVHAAVGFGEQAFNVKTILRTEGRSHAQGDEFAPGDLFAGFDRELIQTAGLFAGRFRAQSRSDYYEFISTHAGDVIVAAADFLEMESKTLEQVVALEVAVEVINLLEVVEIANHHSQS